MKEKIKVHLAHFENDHKLLLKLSQQAADMQEKIIDTILDDGNKAKTLEDAILFLEGWALKAEKDHGFTRIYGYYNRLSKKQRAGFIEHIKKDVMIVAKAKGWF